MAIGCTLHNFRYENRQQAADCVNQLNDERKVPASKWPLLLILSNEQVFETRYAWNERRFSSKS
jgi:hypothetical protein